MNCEKVDDIPTSTSKYGSIKNHSLNRTVKASSSNHHQSKMTKLSLKRVKRQK
jgi:hypothetical protein